MITRTFIAPPITRFQIRILQLAMQMGVSSLRSNWSKISTGKCALTSSWNMDSTSKNLIPVLVVSDKRVPLRQVPLLLPDRSLQVTLIKGRLAGKLVVRILPLPIMICTAPTGRLSMIWEHCASTTWMYRTRHGYLQLVFPGLLRSSDVIA